MLCSAIYNASESMQLSWWNITVFLSMLRNSFIDYRFNVLWSLIMAKGWRPIFAYSSFSTNKVSLQTSLERNPSNLSYIPFLGVNFKNLTVEFHVPYVLNMHIKFHSNRILFTIWSINLFFIHNFRLQKLKILTFVWWHSTWFLIFLKFCKHEGYNKNIQSNG